MEVTPRLGPFKVQHEPQTFNVEMGELRTVRALHEAVREGDAQKVKQLVEQGLNVNQRASDGRTPLELAVEAGNSEIAGILREHGARVRSDAITRALNDGDRAMVQALLGDADHADVFMAAAFGTAAELERLLEQDSSAAGATADWGGTPLHWACARGHTAAARTLLEHGADPNARSTAGPRPLRQALESGNSELIRLLLKEGAEVDESVFVHAVRQDSAELLKVLLKRAGARKTMESNDWRVLHMAAYLGKTEAVRALLDAGADPDVRDRAGLAPLHRAAIAGHVETAKLLLDEGAEVDVRNSRDDTPLLYAVRAGQHDVVELLIEHGADPEAANNADQTPLQAASGQMRELLRRGK